MPELPEVETVRRGLEPALVGARLSQVDLRRPNLRFPFPEGFAERLTGRAVTSLRRRAKYLLADLDDGAILVMHLGMTGRFLVETPGVGAREPGDFHQAHGRERAHDHVRLTLSNGASVTYNDARRFGFMDLLAPGEEASSRHFRGMGVEPLAGALDGPALLALFEGKRTPLKAALLDQRLIAGLGNIYVCEALHRAGLSPARLAGSLEAMPDGPARAQALADAIRAVLEEAIEVGGSTLRDHARTDGTPGAFQERFRVYDREGAGCTTDGCGGHVERLVQSGRSSFHCARCQT